MMVTFAAAYLTVWLAATVCVVRLGIRQRRLEASLRALESQFGAGDAPEESPVKLHTPTSAEIAATR